MLARLHGPPSGRRCWDPNPVSQPAVVGRRDLLLVEPTSSGRHDILWRLLQGQDAERVRRSWLAATRAAGADRRGAVVGGGDRYLAGRPGACGVQLLGNPAAVAALAAANSGGAIQLDARRLPRCQRWDTTQALGLEHPEASHRPADFRALPRQVLGAGAEVRCAGHQRGQPDGCHEAARVVRDLG